MEGLMAKEEPFSFKIVGSTAKTKFVCIRSNQPISTVCYLKMGDLWLPSIKIYWYFTWWQFLYMYTETKYPKIILKIWGGTPLSAP